MLTKKKVSGINRYKSGVWQTLFGLAFDPGQKYGHFFTVMV